MAKEKKKSFKTEKGDSEKSAFDWYEDQIDYYTQTTGGVERTIKQEEEKTTNKNDSNN